MRRAGEVLYLAPRSVRDLIYAGRLPSLRVGRLHYIKTADLELERRRRLGLPLPQPRRARQMPRPPRQIGASPEASARTNAARHARAPRDPALRRQRAAERTALVRTWAQRHRTASALSLPFVVLGVTSPLSCEACGREIGHGRILELAPEGGRAPARLCLACGRRVLLDWADRRRQEAAAARRLSQSLGEPRTELATARVA